MLGTIESLALKEDSQNATASHAITKSMKTAIATTVTIMLHNVTATIKPTTVPLILEKACTIVTTATVAPWMTTTMKKTFKTVHKVSQRRLQLSNYSKNDHNKRCLRLQPKNDDGTGNMNKKNMEQHIYDIINTASYKCIEETQNLIHNVHMDNANDREVNHRKKK